MTTEQAEALVSRVTRVRHHDGREGLYLACYQMERLLLIVEDADGHSRVWPASDCEVAS